MSMNMIQTFSFGVMHNFSMFTIFDSRIPRSTTRASSIASGRGGPASNVGLAKGTISTLVDNTPVFGVSGYGSPTDILMPTSTSVFPSFARALPSADRQLHGLLELVQREMAIHLEEHDLARPRDDREGAVRIPEVVLLLVQVEAHDAVDLAGRAGGHQVPHRHPRVREGHARRRQAGAPRPRIGLQHFDEDVDRCPRELFAEHDRRERLRDDLGNLDGPPIRSGALPIGHAERGHVVPALDERPRRVLQVPRVGLPRPVDGGEDLVAAPLDGGGAVRAPEDSRFDPDRPQLVRFPAVQPSAVRPDQFHLLLDVLDVFHTNCSSGGPRARRGPTFSFDELPDGLREPVGLGALLDQADGARGDGGVTVLSVQPNPAVLSHVDVAPREFREEGDHAPLFSDDPGDLRRRDFHHDAAIETAGLPLLHRQLDPLDLVHAEHVAHDDVADLQVARGVAELHPPRGLRRMERGWIRRVDVDQPVGWPEVDDLADDRVPSLRDVPAIEGDHAHEAVMLVPNAQLRRENLPALDVRSRSGLQPGAADGFARNDNRAERPATFHWCLALTQRVEMEAAT